MQISVENFRTWQNDPVTQALLARLAAWDEEITSYMRSSEVIFSDDAIKHLARMVGQRDMIDFIQNLDFTSIEEREDENSSDSTPSAS